VNSSVATSPAGALVYDSELSSTPKALTIQIHFAAIAITVSVWQQSFQREDVPVSYLRARIQHVHCIKFDCFKAFLEAELGKYVPPCPQNSINSTYSSGPSRESRDPEVTSSPVCSRDRSGPRDWPWRVPVTNAKGSQLTELSLWQPA
jgi:hypothetical protein